MRKMFCSSRRWLVLALLVCSCTLTSRPAEAGDAFPAPRAARPHQPLAQSQSKPSEAKLGPITKGQTSRQDAGGPLTGLSAGFEGIPTDFTLEPPDPSGAAGPSGVLQTVNTRIAYSDKFGNDFWGPIDDAAFWSSVGIQRNNLLSDPHTIFDRSSGRFYTVLLEVDIGGNKSYLNVAVSKNSHPVTSGGADWFFYRFEDTEVDGTSLAWTDYPGLGSDGQAVYVTYNMYSLPFSTSRFTNAVIIVLDKAAFNSGTTNYAFVYTPAGFLNGFTLQPCSVVGPNNPGNVAYFGETLFNTSTSVRIWALSDPLGARSLTSTLVTIPDTGGPPPFSGAPQPGTGITIDTLDGRTQGMAAWYNGSLWFCNTAGGAGGKSLAYFYHINANNYPSGTPTVAEVGFIDGGPGEWTYQPSIGVNALGDVGFVYCQSSATRNPTIFATTRKAAAVVFDTPVLVKASPSYYFGGRWGDYGSVTADPVDESFWVTHEWARSSQLGDWSTWWANVSATIVPKLVVTTNYITGGNGNGIIDFNECNSLLLVLTNIGSLGATNIHATLSTTNPGVFITQAKSDYFNLPIGGVGTNITAFKVSTTPSVICGTFIDFDLLLKCDQLTTTNQIRLFTGTPAAPVRFDNFSRADIPDANPVGTNSLIVVSNINAAISKVTVGVYITHTFDGDLTLQLISPYGVTNTLSANHGFSGANYGLNCSPDSQRTIFDDAASLPIASGFPPFLGSYIPDQPLSMFAGKSGTNVNGTWTLHVVDGAAQDVGTLQCWSLFLSSATCTDGGGECPGADMAIGMVDLPDPLIIGDHLTYTISVTNNGPSSAKNVTVAHVLPGGVSFTSASSSQGSCSQSGGVVTCTLGTVPPRGRATITVVVLPLSPGTLSSSASVSSDEFDFDTSNNSVVALTQVNPATSDLALSLFATPEPVVLGASLVYTVTVSNAGPSDASGVVVTNVLPVSMAIVSATVSQGLLTISNNVVVCSFGGLPSGSHAIATINVTATAEGSFTATSAVSANQFDPIASNNNASFTSTVGPAADLRLGLIDVPDPVVLGSNFVYQISVTNFGPSVATSVNVNQSLPSGVIVVSNYTSQGSNTISGNTLSSDLGTLAVGARATIILVLTANSSGTLTTTAAVTGSQPDPNTANNSATITTLVSVPFVSIAPSGATLTIDPNTNGAIDIGETVTVILRLRNAGNVKATNLTATLLTNTFVIPTNNTPQTYGDLAPSSPAVGRPFNFTANGTNGQTITATLRVQGGGLTTNVSFNFTLPSVVAFSNTTAIAIRDNTSALPYPSTINISGLTGLVSQATATLSNISHTFPQDIDVLLVGPSGQKTILMSGAGSDSSLGVSTLIFTDTAPNPIPDNSGEISSGSWRPADYTGLSLPPPAPAGPYPAAISVFNTVNPNGAWSLFVDDHHIGDTGSIAGGWSLSLTLITPVNQIADLGVSVNDSPDPCLAGNNLTYTFTITNGGPNNASFVTFNNSLPSTVALVSATSSLGTLLTNSTSVTGNIGPLAAGATATVTLVVVPGAAAAGLLTNTASVSASEIDLNPANSTVSAITTINLPLADLSLTQVFATNQVVINSNLTSTITVSNAGPGNALDVLITDPLPAAFGSVVPTASQGVVSNLSGTIYASLGTIAPGSTATLTLNATAAIAGSFTNVPIVSTTSTETNGANNSAAAAIAILNPAPNIIAAGVSMISESGVQNRAIDPGESVTLSFGLRNVGSANTSAGMTATLLATGGVTPSGSTQKVYGPLLQGGPARSNTFSFTANGVSGGTVTASLQLQDGAVNLGTVPFVFNFPAVSTFSNTVAITIPDHGSATPYPSSINVSGLTGLVSNARVTLNGLSHSFPRDVNALLVSPAGANVLLMSHAGGAHAVTNLTLTFDDSASASLPQTGAMTPGSDKPTAYPAAVTLNAPAPARPYGTVLATVNGKAPNGVWSLFIFDDSVGDAGSIAAGWTLELTTVNTINPITDLQVSMSSAPSSLFVGATFTNTINLTNLGPNSATGVYLTNTFPASASVLSSSGSAGSLASSGSGVLIWNIGSLASGSGARVTVALAPSLGGSITNVAVVADLEADLNLVNNSVRTITSVISPLPAVMSGFVTNHQFHLTVAAEPGLPYIIQSSSNLTTWVSLTTNTASPAGTIKFTNSASSKNLFYRAKRRIP